jgi:hypothetical protein
MNIQQLAELGYTCGLHTMGEALTCMELHHYAFTPDSLNALYHDLIPSPDCEIAGDTLCVHVLGEERCAQMDAELDAVLGAGPRDDGGTPFP